MFHLISVGLENMIFKGRNFGCWMLIIDFAEFLWNRLNLAEFPWSDLLISQLREPLFQLLAAVFWLLILRSGVFLFLLLNLGEILERLICANPLMKNSNISLAALFLPPHTAYSNLFLDWGPRVDVLGPKYLAEDFVQRIRRGQKPIYIGFGSMVLDDCPGDPNVRYRRISKGAWPFSTPDHSWHISDCTAEGLQRRNSVFQKHIAAMRLCKDALSLETKDAGDWIYRGEGAANLILAWQLS